MATKKKAQQKVNKVKPALKSGKKKPVVAKKATPASTPKKPLKRLQPRKAQKPVPKMKVAAKKSAKNIITSASRNKAAKHKAKTALKPRPKAKKSVTTLKTSKTKVVGKTKKTATPLKTPKAVLPVQKPLDPVFAKIRQGLLASRTELFKMVESSQELERNVSELTFSNEIDLASSLEGREMVFQLASRDRNGLKLIDDALFKMTQGTYGICESCSKPIGIKRLQILPLTQFCIECQENMEHAS